MYENKKNKTYHIVRFVPSKEEWVFVVNSMYPINSHLTEIKYREYDQGVPYWKDLYRILSIKDY